MISISQRQFVGRNSHADEVYEAANKGRFSRSWDWVLNLFHPGLYCVQRCGVYEGNYYIVSKSDMVKSGTYDTRMFKKGPFWKAFEGAYSECRDFRWQNQTCVFHDN